MAKIPTLDWSPARRDRILANAVTRAAYNKLRAAATDSLFSKWLDMFLGEPVALFGAESAAGRKAFIGKVKSFTATAEKLDRLLCELQPLTGEQISYLGDALRQAMRQMEPWIKPRPRLLLNPRQSQQRRLLERVEAATGRPRCREAYILLEAMYHANGINDPYLTEKQLRDLRREYRANRKKREIGAKKS